MLVVAEFFIIYDILLYKLVVINYKILRVGMLE